MDKFRYVYSNGKEIKTYIYTIAEIENKTPFSLHYIIKDLDFKLISRDKCSCAKDKKGVEIFENDICTHHKQGDRKVIFPMSDSFACFGLISSNGMIGTLQDSERLYEVVSNAHIEALEKF